MSGLPSWNTWTIINKISFQQYNTITLNNNQIYKIIMKSNKSKVETTISKIKTIEMNKEGGINLSYNNNICTLQAINANCTLSYIVCEVLD